jgi:hypothetical protein
MKTSLPIFALLQALPPTARAQVNSERNGNDDMATRARRADLAKSNQMLARVPGAEGNEIK